MNCASCDHWKPYGGARPVKSDDEGQCHRYAPRASMIGISVSEVKWPDTSAVDWCGDYQRHPNRRLQE